MLPNGRRLREVVAASTLQVEGPGLGYLLNPLRIGDAPQPSVWSSWFGPAWRACWTPISCRDAFEFEATHDPVWLDALHSLERHEALLRADPPDTAALLAYATAAGAQAFEGLVALCGHADRRDRYRRALEARHKPCVDTLEEARDVMREVEADALFVPGVEEIATRVPELLALARHRFAFHERAWALDFDSPLPMATILARLRAHSDWHWHARDSDRFGPYTTSSPEPGVLLRLYDLDGYDSNGPSYTFEVQARAPCLRDREQIDGLVEGLLAVIEGSDIRPGQFLGR